MIHAHLEKSSDTNNGWYTRICRLVSDPIKGTKTIRGDGAGAESGVEKGVNGAGNLHFHLRPPEAELDVVLPFNCLCSNLTETSGRLDHCHMRLDSCWHGISACNESWLVSSGT